MKRVILAAILASAVVLSGCSAMPLLDKDMVIPVPILNEASVLAMQANGGIVPGKLIMGAYLSENDNGVFKIAGGQSIRNGMTLHAEFIFCNHLDEPAVFEFWLEQPSDNAFTWYPQFKRWSEALQCVTIRDDSPGTPVAAKAFKSVWVDIAIPSTGDVPDWMIFLWGKNTAQTGFGQYVNGAKIICRMQ